MADYNSSLPIRTEAAGDVVVKLGDATTPAQQASVDASGRVLARITDTAGNSLTSTGSSLNVNMTNGLSVGVADKNAFTYGTTTDQVVGGVFQDTTPTLTAGQSGAVRLTTNRAFHSNLRTAAGVELLGSATSANSIPVVIASDQAAIAVTQSTSPWVTQDAADGPVAPGAAATKSILGGAVYNSSAPTLTTSQQAALQSDSSGNLKINLITALPTGSNVIGAVTQSGTWTVAQGVPNTNTNGWFTRLTDGTSNVAVKAASTAALAADPSLVVALSPNSPLPTGTNSIGSVSILVAGAANSPTNPLYVTSESQAGTPVNAYNTSASVAAAATATFDYTVTAAKVFYGTQLWVSGSGKIKVQLSFETAAASGTFVVVWTGFNSTAIPNVLVPLADKTQIASAKVRVVITNRDGQAQDVYSTLSGTEI